VLPLILKFGHLHFIREDGGGGTVLTNEAHFFMYDCPDGAEMRLLRQHSYGLRQCIAQVILERAEPGFVVSPLLEPLSENWLADLL
jgi:hypothetical protein